MKGLKAVRFFVADIGGTSVKMGVINEKGQFIFEDTYPTESKRGGLAIIEELRDKIAVHLPIDGIGISTAGQVDEVHGVIKYANENIPRYTGVDVKGIIKEVYDVPIVVENDVNAAALGEAYFGSAKGKQDFLCLTYGTGIGGAIYLHGDLYRGNSQVAGEFGHMITHVNGRVCACGMKGCYEQYASVTALVTKAQEITNKVTDGKVLIQMYNQGDTAIAEILDTWIIEVCAGLISLINIFNPRTIVLGGGLMEQAFIIDKINEHLITHVHDSVSPIDIIPAQLGNKAGMLGVGAQLIQI